MLENHEQKKPTHDFDGITENRVNSPPLYFNLLFYGLIVWGVIFIAYFLLSGWSSHQEFTQKMETHEAAYSSNNPAVNAPKNPIPPAATTAPSSETLFADHCAGCHGAEGEGGFGSDLTDSYTYGKDPASVHESIRAGRGGKMPSFADRLTSEQIDSLVEHLLQL